MKSLFSASFASCLLVLAAALPGPARGQNQLPVIEKARVLVDRQHRQLTVTCRVSDPERQPLRVSLRVSADGGRTYVIDPAGAAGDPGHPVRSGARKKITWQYPDTLDPAALRVKLVADDLHPVDVAELVARVDSQRMARDMARIYGTRHYEPACRPHLEAVKNTIEQQFQRHNLRSYRQAFDHHGYTAHNLAGVVPGTDETRAFVLGAHFDTESDSPGADDNGSGVVGMLEAMRILSAYHYRHSLEFVGFDLEEEGWLGSRAFVSRRGNSEARIGGVINFDMIGFYSEQPGSQVIPEGFSQLYPDVYQRVSTDAFRGNFVISTANGASLPLAETFAGSARRYVPGLKVVSLLVEGNGEATPSLAASDHVPFWRAGHAALHVGDGGESRNPALDTEHDVLDRLNYTFMTNVVKATVATLAQLAGISHCTVAYPPVTVR